MRPLVAIVGRANVGKSTLFNRLLGIRQAIISSTPGTTRDRIYEKLNWQGKEFDLVDTGGIFFEQKTEYEKDIILQVGEALKLSDLILFLIDMKEGTIPQDKKVLEKIRKSGKKIILVANKADNQKLREEAENLAKLGLGNPFIVSAIHGTGTGDLLDEIVKSLEFSKVNKVKSKEKITKIAIIGRPNVGKSSLFNKLIGKEQAIVSDIPGTTRDVINTEAVINNRKYLFLDTAGLRRRTKVKKQIEYYSVLRALKAIEKADIALFLIDATEGIARQDLHIISEIIEKGKGLILLVNKWDIVKLSNSKVQVENITMESYISYLQNKMPFLSWAPVIFISAKTNKNIFKIPELIKKVSEEREKRVKIKELNAIISEAIFKKPPPQPKKGKAKIVYTTQANGVPPAFIIFVSDKDIFKKPYLNYLENRIRKKYSFIGNPIKIILRSKK